MSQPATIQPIPTLFGRVNRRAIVALYAASAFLFWAAQYIFLPTLPTYAQTKVGDLATVGIVLSMYGLWQALVRLPLGIASDWLGARKPFIVIGLAFGAVGAWMMATSNDAVGLAIGRAITGASAGTWVVLIVAFSALFPPREAVRASALLTSFNSFGRILATAVNGSLIDLGGYTLPFFVAAGLGLLSAIILFPIDETRRAPKAPSLSGIGGLLMRRDVFLPTMLSTVMQYVLWTTSFGFVLVLAKQLGATNVLQSLIVTLHITITVLGNFIASSRKNPFSNRQLITASFI
ncbi:partial Inner membrane transport protein YajR, partial [Anaerolineae bacterium]